MFTTDRFNELWDSVYPGERKFRDKASGLIRGMAGAAPEGERDWFRRAVIYSLYVDFFNGTILGLMEKLPYLEDLGINCLWLLPVLDSPMLDAGFDIRSYRHIRSELASSGDPDGEFDSLLSEAHRRGIRIIFDIALNHCSTEHPWFVDARSAGDSRYRDFFIWSDTDAGYADARIIFKGLCRSNWERDESSGQYYFHRFFETQPDLNYRNPELLYEMISILLSWLIRGIDGFRADAIPYLWKEEGTSCENLPGTHRILKIIRYALETVKPGTLFLAEANQKPGDVVDYISSGDECNAAYHFPLMPQVFKALAVESGEPVRAVLSPEVTPNIPVSASWVTFLRCHDELTLEMVSPEERAIIYGHYARRPEWDFRQGEGIAGRLFTLLQGNVDKIIAAYTLIFTLPGTPVVYYGDEVGLSNDVDFWERQKGITGYDDSRYLNRGPLDWADIEMRLSDSRSSGSIIRGAVRELVRIKRTVKALSGGPAEFFPSGNRALLFFNRTGYSDTVLVLCNLSSETVPIPEMFLTRFSEGAGVLFSRGISSLEGSTCMNPWGSIVVSVRTGA